MITIILIAIFLFAGWITLIIPLSINHTVEITLCAVMGLAAVNIAGFTMIIRRLELLLTKKTGDKDKKDKTSEPDKAADNDSTP